MQADPHALWHRMIATARAYPCYSQAFKEESYDETE